MQDGPSYTEIELFRTIEHSVLFGVNRFWRGVDFPGYTCSQVIVLRCPNPSLGFPLIGHRSDHLGNFWEGFYRPTVELRLKQQFAA